MIPVEGVMNKNPNPRNLIASKFWIKPLFLEETGNLQKWCIPSPKSTRLVKVIRLITVLNMGNVKSMYKNVFKLPGYERRKEHLFDWIALSVVTWDFVHYSDKFLFDVRMPLIFIFASIWKCQSLK